MSNLKLLLSALIPRARANGPVDVVLNADELQSIVSALDFSELVANRICDAVIYDEKGCDDNGNRKKTSVE